jgi:hypothetical protein
MAEGVRLQLVVSLELAEAIRDRAKTEGRSVSGFGADLLADAMKRLKPAAKGNP